jgi:hypothetical protein
LVSGLLRHSAKDFRLPAAFTVSQASGLHGAGPRRNARFDRLSTQSKHLVDTIKMIAYRAETAVAQIVRQTMSRHDDARTLLRAVCSTEIDLIPDQEAKTLAVRLHPLANTSSDQALKHLCAEISATGTQFPGRELRLTYELVSAQTP